MTLVPTSKTKIAEALPSGYIKLDFQSEMALTYRLFPAQCNASRILITSKLLTLFEIMFNLDR